MCLIAYSPLSTFIPPEYLDSAFRTNSHGFGLMFPENGKVKVIKGMYPIDQIKHLYKRYKNENIALHFRMATAGTKGPMNCHPFQLLSLEEDGMDLYLMHNGTFFEYRDGPNGESDTAMFAKHLAYRMRNEGFSLNKPECVQELEDNASWNKLLFMNGWGDVTIINEKSGDKDKGCWYSYAVKNRFNYYSSYSNSSNTSSSSNRALAVYNRQDDPTELQEEESLVDWWNRQFNNNRGLYAHNSHLTDDELNDADVIDKFTLTARELEELERGTDEERIEKYARKCAEMMDLEDCSFYEAGEYVVGETDFFWGFYEEIENATNAILEKMNDNSWEDGLRGFNE